MTSTAAVGLGAELICRPDRSLDCQRRFFRRSRVTQTEQGSFASNDWSRQGKGVGYCRRNKERKDSRDHRDFNTDRIDKCLRGSLV